MTRSRGRTCAACGADGGARSVDALGVVVEIEVHVACLGGGEGEEEEQREADEYAHGCRQREMRGRGMRQRSGAEARRGAAGEQATQRTRCPTCRKLPQPLACAP